MACDHSSYICCKLGWLSVSIKTCALLRILYHDRFIIATENTCMQKFESFQTKNWIGNTNTIFPGTPVITRKITWIETVAWEYLELGFGEKITHVDRGQDFGCNNAPESPFGRELRCLHAYTYAWPTRQSSLMSTIFTWNMVSGHKVIKHMDHQQQGIQDCDLYTENIETSYGCSCTHACNPDHHRIDV